MATRVQKTAVVKDVLQTLGQSTEVGNEAHVQTQAAETAEQNGKESLPPTPEQATEACPTPPLDPAQVQKPDEEDEDEGDAQDDDLVPIFTKEDRADLAGYEAGCKRIGIELARMLRNIRNRKLWMLHKVDDAADDPGSGSGPRKYKNFDHYVQEVHGHSRQWVTEQTQWLAVIDTLVGLRAKGVDVPDHLSATAVSGLYHLIECGNYQGDTEAEQEEAGLIAVLHEAVEDGLYPSGDNLRAICGRRYKYFRQNSWDVKPLAPTYDEYRKDIVSLKALAEFENSRTAGVKAKQWAETHKAPMSEAVLAIYKTTAVIPDDDFLLGAVTGDDLVALVSQLVASVSTVANLGQLEEEYKRQRQELNRVKDELGKQRAALQSDPDDDPDGEDEDDEETDRTVYTVEATGDFAVCLGWPTKDEVDHEDLLNLFETLAGKCSPLTQPSSITVVPVAHGEEEAGDDLEQHEPEEVPADGSLAE